MKKELIGILICTLLIIATVLPATGTVNNIENPSDGQQIVTKEIASLTNGDDFYWRPALRPYDIGEIDSLSIGDNVISHEGIGGYVK